MKKAVLLFMAVLLTGAVYAGEAFPVAAKGKPAAEIVIGTDQSPSLRHAAEELALGVRIVSGAELPIVEKADGKSGGKIVMGLCSSLPSGIGKYVDQIKWDGFGVERKNGVLYIYAKRYRGLINAVNRLLFRNTDLVWARPAGDAVVSGSNPDLAFKETDFAENPAFMIRGFGGTADLEWNRWSSRNMNNDQYFENGHPKLRKIIAEMLKTDPVKVFGGGHNMTKIWMPVSKYAKTHPEYYTFLDGKRRNKGGSHICVTNQEMKKVFIENALQIVKKLPQGMVVSMSQDDWDIGCECAECQKPFKLPDGRVLTNKDRKFKTTQWFMFLNEVAEEIHKVRPDLMISVFAYVGSAVPPEVKLFKTLMISYCPVPANHKRPLLDDVSNARWKRDTFEWAKQLPEPQMKWREYWHCFKAFPHPISENVARDLQILFRNRIGIAVYSETTHNWRPDNRKQLSKNGWNRLDCSGEFWDMDAQEQWVISHLLWNPEQDATKLRNEFFCRVYREAAPHIMKYHDLIRKAWNADSAAVPSVQEDHYAATGYYILNKNLKDPCRAELVKAVAAAKHPVSKQLAQNMLATFDKWCSRAPSMKDRRVDVPKVKTDAYPGFDFVAEPWNHAVSFPAFSIMSLPAKRAKYLTEVKAFHDGKYLYLGIRCPDPQAATFRVYPKEDRDKWPKGEHIELFLCAKEGAYYQLAWNLSGTIYDALTSNTAWNGNWEVRIRRGEDSWTSVVRFPLEGILLKDKGKDIVRGLIFRSRSNTASPSENSSWCGGTVHDTNTFGEMILLP